MRIAIGQCIAIGECRDQVPCVFLALGSSSNYKRGKKEKRKRRKRGKEGKGGKEDGIMPCNSAMHMHCWININMEDRFLPSSLRL